MTLIDALRGIAALLVVATHAMLVIYPCIHSQNGFYAAFARVLDMCRYGVDVFFVISGFVIAFSIGAEKVDGKYAAKFALRRSLRLDPPYWVAIAAVILINFLQRIIRHNSSAMPTVPQVIAHLFYLQQILGYAQINIVFWTLCLEVQFYLVFVLLIMASRALSRAPSTRAWVTFGAFIFSLLWPAALFPTSGYFIGWFGPHWHKFLIGALVWYAWAGYLPHYMLYVPVALLMLAISLRMGPSPMKTEVAIGIWVGLGTALVFVAAAKLEGFYRWLRWPVLQFLGLISYSVYLIHVPMIAIAAALQRRFFGSSRVGVWISFAEVFVFSILMGWVMNRVVEQPSLRLADRFRVRQK